jgi:agmatine deiminase
MRTALALLSSLFILCLLGAGASAQAAEPWDEKTYGPLPHWGPTLPGPEPALEQPLHPFAVHAGDERATLPSGLVESVAEYDPAAGILFRYSNYAWPQVVTDCVAAITGDPTKTDRAYVIVADSSLEASATAAFTAAGADMSKVEFFHVVSDSIWLTDYGPSFVRQDGAHSIVDSCYYMIGRTLDDFVPTQVAEDNLLIPNFHMGMTTSARGNLLVGPGRSAFVSTIIGQYNPTFSYEEIAQYYQDYLGIDTLHVFPKLPGSVDLTGHIDMWMYVVDESNVIISEFEPGSDQTAIQITENAVTYMTDLGFNVFRTPDHVGSHPSWPGANIHYTYTNALRINDRILVLSFGEGDPALIPNDLAAAAAWQAAAPGCEIIPIPCYDIIWAAGALHCISMNVPKRPDLVPAVHVNSPKGGEFLASGATHELEWAAADDVDVTGIDVSYSLDGGLTFPHVVATGLANDSHEEWVVPDLPSPSDQAVLKVTAHDGDLNAGEGVSETTFVISDALRTVYDFSTGGDELEPARRRAHADDVPLPHHHGRSGRLRQAGGLGRDRRGRRHQPVLPRERPRPRERVVAHLRVHDRGAS